MSPYNDGYDDDDDNDESSNLLSTKQTYYFFTNYVVVLALFFSGAASSVYYATTVNDRGYCWINTVYLAMIVLQFNSHLCAIHSCFIFSKIIYKVTNMLKNLQKQKRTSINIETTYGWRWILFGMSFIRCSCIVEVSFRTQLVHPISDSEKAGGQQVNSQQWEGIANCVTQDDTEVPLRTET